MVGRQQVGLASGSSSKGRERKEREGEKVFFLVSGFRNPNYSNFNSLEKLSSFRRSKPYFLFLANTVNK